MIAPAMPAPQQVPDRRKRLKELSQEVSATRLTTFTTCRLKFFFRYVLKLESKPSPALHLGKAVHAVLQSWNMARWRNQILPEDKLKEIFDQKWLELQLGQEINWKDDEEDEKQMGWKLLQAYLAKSPIPNGEKPEGVEVTLEVDLAHLGLPKVKGVLDLVRGNGTIVDFKTSGQTPDPVKVEHQTEVQLTCYGLLYREATGRMESGFELHHLVKLKTPKVVITALEPITERQLTRLYKVMESYQEGVLREDFVPSPGMACLSCEFFNQCRRWS